MDAKRINTAVFGLGYVGLPLSLSYSIKGCKVYGIDVSEELVAELKSGITHHLENYKGKSIQQILNESIGSGMFIPLSEASEAFNNCNKYIITVGIPSTKDGLNFNFLKNACRTLSSGLKKGDVVIIRSTVVPGTTEEMLLPLLEESGLKAGTDFYLCYCPERISEGNAFEEFENLEIVISGINKKSIKKGIEVIKLISGFEPAVVSSIKAAETVKVLENVQRDVNIAMVQQFAAFCRKFDINIFELVEATNTHPRVNLLKPGPGVGGYCIPNALQYLKPKACELNSDIELLELSRKINANIPLKMADEIKDYFLRYNKSPLDTKIAFLGIAMKDYCSDDRQSAVLEIIKKLMDSGFFVKAYDPYVSTKYEFKADSIPACLEKADALIITALQHGIDYNNFVYFKSLMKNNPVIFDTRNIINKPEAEKHGFHVVKLL